MRVFLSKEFEVRASSEDGIVVPGEVPEWDTQAQGPNAEYVKAVAIKRKEDSYALGVYAVEEYGIGEIVTSYGGRLVLGNNGDYLFSEHVATVMQGFEYVDGFYGAGAWPIERVQAEHCAGAALNSN